MPPRAGRHYASVRYIIITLEAVDRLLTRVFPWLKRL